MHKVPENYSQYSASRNQMSKVKKLLLHHFANLMPVKRFVPGFKRCVCLQPTHSSHTLRSPTSPNFATWKFSLTLSTESTGMISSIDWVNFKTFKS